MAQNTIKNGYNEHGGRGDVSQKVSKNVSRINWIAPD